MGLGNRSVDHRGVLWPRVCVCVWGCVGATQRARVSHHQLSAAHSNTLHLLPSLLASRSYPVLTHLPPRPEDCCSSLSLSLRLLIHCWNESPEWRWSLSVSVVEAALSHSLLWCSLSVYVGYVRLEEEWMMHASFTLLSSTTEQRQTICASSWIFSAHSEH